MFKNVRMHTVWLPMCSTVVPMARAGGGDITGNVLGQGFTSPSPCTHVQGAYGAPTGAVGGAANGRRREIVTTQRYTLRLRHFTKLHGRTPHTPLSAATKFGYVAMPPWYLFIDKVAKRRF